MELVFFIVLTCIMAFLSFIGFKIFEINLISFILGMVLVVDILQNGIYAIAGQNAGSVVTYELNSFLGMVFVIGIMLINAFQLIDWVRSR